MKQQVVIYQADGKTNVYATGYDQEQVREQIMHCVRRHGRHARVCSVDAEQHWAASGNA